MSPSPSPEPSPISVIGRCNLPPGVLAPQTFQDDPSPMEILGVRQAESGLFDRLDSIEDPELRREAFHEYMALRFQIDPRSAAEKSSEKVLQRHYMHFLLG